MTHRPLQATLSQQALALGLSALITAGVLSGLLGLAGQDAAALLAQQQQRSPQAVTALQTPPKA
jgi:hydroxymethylglutaryl-CoA reductase